MKDKKPHLELVNKKPAAEPRRELSFDLSINVNFDPVFENDEVILYRFQSQVFGEESPPSYHILAKVTLSDSKK